MTFRKGENIKSRLSPKRWKEVVRKSQIARARTLAARAAAREDAKAVARGAARAPRAVAAPTTGAGASIAEFTVHQPAETLMLLAQAEANALKIENALAELRAAMKGSRGESG